MDEITITEYTYWGAVNKLFVAEMTFFATFQFIMAFFYDVVIAYLFCIICLLFIVWALYSALPPKWVRDFWKNHEGQLISKGERI